MSFTLEILKAGQVLTILPLNTPLLRLGSHPTNHLVCHNPSISRFHAELRIQNGLYYLYDLDSTHGTTLNHQPVKKEGEALQDGDVFTMGQSKRMFVVVRNQDQATGDQLVIEKLKKTRDYTQENNKKESLLEQYKRLLGVSRRVEQSMEGVSWGISDEKEVYDHHQDYNLPIDTTKLMSLQGMTERQRAKVQVYQDKKRQLERIQGGKGEQAVLQQNRMEAELYQAEESLRMSLFGSQLQINTTTIKNIQNEDTFNQDDFYDRTHKKQTSGLDKYSYQELITKMERLKEVKRRISTKLVQMEQQDQQQPDDQDEYEYFMRENEKELSTQKQKEFLSRLQDINTQLAMISTKMVSIDPPIKTEQGIHEKEQLQQQPRKKIKMENEKDKVSRQLSQLAQLDPAEEELDEQGQLDYCAQLIREEEEQEPLQIDRPPEQKPIQKYYSVMPRPASRHSCIQYE